MNFQRHFKYKNLKYWSILQIMIEQRFTLQQIEKKIV